MMTVDSTMLTPSVLFWGTSFFLWGLLSWANESSSPTVRAPDAQKGELTPEERLRQTVPPFGVRVGRSADNPVVDSASDGTFTSASANPWPGRLFAAWLVLTVYGFLFLWTERWIFSTSLGLLLILLLWAGNHLKVAILDEVLVFSDIFLAGHALRYPRLYFGYAPKWIWPVLIAALGTLAAGGAMETPVLGRGLTWTVTDKLLISLLWCVGTWVIIRKTAVPNALCQGVLKRYPLTFDAARDAARYSPLGAGLLHSLHHGQYRMALREQFRRSESSVSNEGKEAPHTLPHRLLIQAESYIPLSDHLDRPSVTPVLDHLRQTAQSGALPLAWRGAYTMRTEFTVLTGIFPQKLETYGFDPYRLAAVIPMASLATEMKRQGYRTVAAHPNDGRFFDRNHVLQNLGFDEFLDREALEKQEPAFRTEEACCGRYVSDDAFLAWAVRYLEKAETPTFLFLVTMEAHGPWDATKFPGAEKLSEVERYETHLRHLDRGVETILNAQKQGLDVEVRLYGDHWPGLKVLQKKARDLPPDTVWIEWNRKDAESFAQGKH